MSWWWACQEKQAKMQKCMPLSRLSWCVQIHFRIPFSITENMNDWSFSWLMFAAFEIILLDLFHGHLYPIVCPSLVFTLALRLPINDTTAVSLSYPSSCHFPVCKYHPLDHFLSSRRNDPIWLDLVSRFLPRLMSVAVAGAAARHNNHKHGPRDYKRFQKECWSIVVMPKWVFVVYSFAATSLWRWQGSFNWLPCWIRPL